MAGKLERLTFDVVSGKHVHSDGKLYKKGDRITCLEELDKLFGPKFKRVVPIEPEASPEKRAPAKRRATKKAAKDEGLGDDVTTEFPEASRHKLTVRRRGAWHHVYEAGKATPVNDKGLAKGDVKEFVAGYLEQ